MAKAEEMMKAVDHVSVVGMRSAACSALRLLKQGRDRR